MNNKPFISSEELDRIFDEGEEDILEYLDFSKARRPGLEANKIQENYQETIQSTKENLLIISITMLELIVSCIVVIFTFLDSDLDNEENTESDLDNEENIEGTREHCAALISTDSSKKSKSSKKSDSSEKSENIA